MCLAAKPRIPEPNLISGYGDEKRPKEAPVDQLSHLRGLLQSRDHQHLRLRPQVGY